MSNHKRLCLSLLNKDLEDTVGLSSVLLVGCIGDNLEKIASELLHEADIHKRVMQVYTSNKLPIAGMSCANASTVVCKLLPRLNKK